MKQSATTTLETKPRFRQLAVMFRVNDPNLGHCSTFDTITEAGLAYSYGLFRAIPKRNRNKRQDLAVAIASQLDRKADALERGAQ